jgi:voltage-gated potassium channel
MKYRRLLVIPIVILLILLVGTVGYHAIEPKITLFESFYITAINITTLGYADVKPLTTGGRVFNLIMIILAWIGIFISARIIGQFFIGGEIADFLGRKKMEKQLSSISGHYIVCGYGRVGKVVCENFATNHVPFVVIEREAGIIEDAKIRGYLFINGDCTDDDTLSRAVIGKAKGLINAIADEADAVYVTLSAKQHNPNIFIMARADSSNAEVKLKRAGADRVISPQAAAGARMAMAAIRPAVVDFLSIAATRDEGSARVEEVAVLPGSVLVGKSLKDVDIRSKYGLNVLGVIKPGGDITYNPGAEYIVQTDDTLIMFGSEAQLARVDELFSGTFISKSYRGAN